MSFDALFSYIGGAGPGGASTTLTNEVSCSSVYTLYLFLKKRLVRTIIVLLLQFLRLIEEKLDVQQLLYVCIRPSIHHAHMSLSKCKQGRKILIYIGVGGGVLSE